MSKDSLIWQMSWMAYTFASQACIFESLRFANCESWRLHCVVAFLGRHVEAVHGNLSPAATHRDLQVRSLESCPTRSGRSPICFEVSYWVVWLCARRLSIVWPPGRRRDIFVAQCQTVVRLLISNKNIVPAFLAQRQTTDYWGANIHELYDWNWCHLKKHERIFQYSETYLNEFQICCCTQLECIWTVVNTSTSLMWSHLFSNAWCFWFVNGFVL